MLKSSLVLNIAKRRASTSSVERLIFADGEEDFSDN